jgi:tether containing UBX domain for GLUT4
VSSRSFSRLRVQPRIQLYGMAEPSSSSSSASPSSVLLTSISPVDPSKQRTFTARYYTQPASSTASTGADLPDSYFQPTAQELQRAHAQAISHREHLVDRPLLTSKLRDQQRADKQRTKANKFPRTTIRIRFHGGQSLLEGQFNSATDKLVHVYEFVKLALQPRLRHVPFLLYQSPPRQESPRDDPTLRGKSLLDLDFAPSTSLYLKFLPPPPSSQETTPAIDVDTLNATSTSPSELLIPELIQAATELPRPPSFDPTTTTGDNEEATGPPPPSSEEQKKKDKEERLRKLLGGGGGGGGKGGMFGGGGGKSEFSLPSLQRSSS